MPQPFVVFDLETILACDEILAAQIDEPKAPSNYRDEAKIAAYVEDAKLKAVEGAALKAEMCQIAMVGFKQGKAFSVFDLESHKEADLVRIALQELVFCIEKGMLVVGFNIHGFDLPLLVRRAIILGVPVPVELGSWWRDRWSWHECLWDLADRWALGTRDTIKLGKLAAALGVTDKLGDGKDFPKLWETDRVAARAYHHQDLQCEYEVALRLIPELREAA